MDIGAIMSIAAGATTDSAIAASMLVSTENLVAVQADIMMASLGIGSVVNTFA